MRCWDMQTSWARSGAHILQLTLTSGEAVSLQSSTDLTFHCRLWLTSGGEGAVYSVTGEVVRRWGRDTEAVFQPLVFPLNKHLTLQLPRKAEAIINFTPNQHNHVKFIVSHKLKEVQTHL